MDIDAVYTWVDGNDPVWKEKKAIRLKELGRPVPITANHDSRFIQHDELKYSLRSLYRFAPWIRKVYIVTDNQIPSWFDVKNDWVKIVDHTEIFEDHSALPTFNSNAIETRLHRIPGLSENYLYFNDDFFLGRPCTKRDFFSKDGKPFVFIEKRNLFTSVGKCKQQNDRVKNRNEYKAGLTNSRLLVESLTGKYCKVIISHGVQTFTKSYVNMISKLFELDYTKTTMSPFRTFRDVQSFSLHHFYTLVTGNSVLRRTPEIRSRKHFIQNIISRCSKYLYKYIVLDSKLLESYIANLKKYDHFMFCINDDNNAPEEAYKIVTKFLHDFYPDKSPAEL